MQKRLQVISEVLTTLQVPENALQVALIAAALGLGWWAAKYVRSRITVSPDPDNIPDRLRKLLYVGAPQSLVLAVLATLDGLMHAFGLQAGMVDVAVQLVGLLLLIRVTVYVIRVSLGATSREVITLFMRSGLVLVAIGGAVGLALGLLVAQAAGSLLFHEAAIDPLVFFGVPLLLLSVSGLATFLPARRAMRMSPSSALRSG